MGKSSCCEKVGLKKGPWTPEEDQKLLAYIDQHGHGSWRALPAKAGLQRCGKSCRLRWTNYLRPDIKRGKFSLHEEQTIIQLHALLGNRWSAIATHLPKRTDNEIKNYWNTHIKKRLTKMGIDPMTHKPKTDSLGPGGGQFKDAANLSHMAQWESARLEAEARLVRESKLMSNTNNSLLSQLGFSASSAHLMITNPAATSGAGAAPPPPPSRPPCLDVLKAWQGVVLGMFGVDPTAGATATTDLESPTSTLNFSGKVLPLPTAVGFNNESSCKGGGSENEWKCLERMELMKNHHHNNSTTSLNQKTTSYNTEFAWNHLGDTFRAENMIIEGLCEALVCDNSQQSYQMGGDDENQINGSCCNSSYDQENQNYWNSLLIDLADVSRLPDSPVF